MIEVALVEISDGLPVDVDILARKLNSLTKIIKFTKALSISPKRLGAAEINGVWHCTDVFFRLLKEQHHEQFASVIGLTSARITTRTPYPDDLGKDYFSDQDYDRTGVITLNNQVLLHNSPTKDVYQYTAFALVEILLGNLIKQDLHHDRKENCLFHDCADRAAFAEIIEASVISTDCLAMLEKGVSKDVLNDAYKILNWCRRFGGTHSPINSTLQNPYVAFVCGTGAGWLISSLLPSDNPKAILAVLCVSLTMPLITLCYYRIKNNRRSSSRNPH